MKLSRYFLTIGLLTTTAFFSCKKNNKNCVAGTGGNLAIVVFPKHHTVPIFNKANYLDTVFVKFNTNDAPSDGVYDTFFIGMAGNDHVRLEGLKCGKYYFLATGFDTTIQQRVVGAIPFTTDKNDGKTELTIPVTEVH